MFCEIEEEISKKDLYGLPSVRPSLQIPLAKPKKKHTLLGGDISWRRGGNLPPV